LFHKAGAPVCIDVIEQLVEIKRTPWTIRLGYGIDRLVTVYMISSESKLLTEPQIEFVAGILLSRSKRKRVITIVAMLYADRAEVEVSILLNIGKPIRIA